MKRFASLFLAAWMLLPLLVSCASNPSGDDAVTGTTAAAESTSVAETTTEDPNDRSKVKDNVPDDLKFDGETIRIVMRGTPGDGGLITLYDVEGSDNVGDYVTDGVWERNRQAEERLNVTMELSGYAGALGDVSAAIKTLVMSGSDEFDYIHSTGNTNIINSLNLYLRDLADMPHVDYSAPWWWEEVNKSVTLDGKTYNYIYGDSLIHCYIQTGVFYYNKALYEDVFGDPDEMYKVVMDGKWTIDKLIELTEAGYSDVNGDGVPNDGDIFGAMKSKSPADEAPHFLEGFDLSLYTRGEDGSLVIEFDQERCMLGVEKLNQYNMSTPGLYNSDQTIDNGSAKYFSEGRFIFFPARFARVLHSTFRDMEDPYGILPFPKLDEEQKEYKSLSHCSSTNISVPKTVSDDKFEIVGAWLECITAESWRSIMPLFLEMALKMKYSQDSMSGQVIDIVVNSVSKNTLHEYGAFSSNIYTSVLINNATGPNNNFASSYRKVGPAAQKSWDKAVENLLKEG